MINYEQKIFQFTVDLNEDNTINPIQLRTKYRDFLNNILSSMGNKYIQFSDFYVEEKTNSSIKFGLYILSIIEKLIYIDTKIMLRK